MTTGKGRRVWVDDDWESRGEGIGHGETVGVAIRTAGREESSELTWDWPETPGSPGVIEAQGRYAIFGGSAMEGLKAD